MPRKTKSRRFYADKFASALMELAADTSVRSGTPITKLLPSYENNPNPRAPLKGGLWSANETANYLNVSKQTLANWRHKGNGPQYSKLGSRVGYEPRILKQFVRDNALANTSQHN